MDGQLPIGAVSRLTGVTVRALHHYDQVALLTPSDRSNAGYRLYNQDDLGRLRQIAAAIDKELEASRMGIPLNPEEQFEIFGDTYQQDYAAEAERRWGDTEAYRQSQRRVAGYDKQQWQQIKAESDAIEAGFVRLLGADVPADSDAAMAAAQEHRRHIETWFNDVPLAMHRCLAQMYLADERFTDYYDRQAPGLAEYVSAAIIANADRQAG